MKKILVFLMLGSLFAFDVNAAASTTRKPAQSLSAKNIETLFSKIDDNCAGNDNGGVMKFDPKKFKSGKAKKELRKGNNGCKGMKMSKSKEEAVSAFSAYFKSSNDDFTACVNENLTESERVQVIQVISDPENLGVFSSQYNGKDESEACYFHHFDIYRASGQKISIVHDETD